MRTTLVVALVVTSLAACVLPAAQAPVAQSSDPRVAARVRTDITAEADLRRALARRGLPLDVVDGPMAPLGYDQARTVTWTDGGASATLAGPGAWRFATIAGQYWVFENGLVLPA